ncbi:TetR family transcriptional regulator [Streptomyces sp. NPDC001980]|uniref:TetR/AcrR family transcriptional regulator n=1 Tax=Streptomyces sp. NPDC001980 TaxID=3157126 RepID=UPI00332896EA
MNDAEPAEEPPRRRRRDPEGHRAAILEAARHTFAERGYTRTTLREVARRAGVTHGLITRNFSSKERLFLAAVPGNRDLERVAAGDAATLPERIAHAFVERMETDAANDPLITLLRSAAHDEHTAAHLLTAMQEHSAAVYRSVLSPDEPGKPGEPGESGESGSEAGGEPATADGDLDTRVALVGAQMIGVAFSRYIARTEPLASLPADRLTDHLARVLRHILFA